jgi:transcriptional regulator with XRE-family HTH domain
MASYMDRQLREKGVTRDALAHKVGISTGRVSALLNGGKPWYLEDVDRFSTGLGLDPLVVLEEFAREQGEGNVVPLLPDPGPGTPHPDLSTVSRWADDDDAAADESPDEDALREERGE